MDGQSPECQTLTRARIQTILCLPSFPFPLAAYHELSHGGAEAVKDCGFFRQLFARGGQGGQRHETVRQHEGKGRR